MIWDPMQFEAALAARDDQWANDRHSSDDDYEFVPARTEQQRRDADARSRQAWGLPPIDYDTSPEWVATVGATR